MKSDEHHAFRATKFKHLGVGCASSVSPQLPLLPTVLKPCALAALAPKDMQVCDRPKGLEHEFL